ncbi:hypothetical protein ACG7TL_008627 [Trametes sanguinea]
MRSRDSTGAGCAGRPTYAQIAALSVPSEPLRSRHESKQPARSLVTVLRERSSTASFGNLARRIHPLLASLITPVPQHTSADSQGTSRGAPGLGRSSGVADSGNWRAQRLSENTKLNTEFAPSPSPAMQPRAQAAAQGSQMRGSMLSIAGRVQLRDLMQQAQGRRDVIASSMSTFNHPMATRKGATIQGGQEDNQRRNGQDANCREAIAPQVRSACGIAPLVLERTTKLGEKASGCGSSLVSGQSTGTEDVFLSATMSSRVLPATSGNLGNSSEGAKAGTRLGDNAVDALSRALGENALLCASLPVCSTSGSVEPLVSSSSLEAKHQLSAVHAPSSKHEVGLPTTTLSRQGPDVAVPTSISTSSATRSTSASTPSRPRTRTTRASQSPFDRYNPWVFKQQAVDGGVANRGHQATPRGLSRHQRAASILASMEA